MRTLKGIAALGVGLLALPVSAQTRYAATNLVANTSGYGAATIDPNLVNPWGLSSSTTSPWWTSNNGTGVSTLYNGLGAKIGLTVTIPPPAGGSISSPTGQLFNTTTDFQVGAGQPARFLFATEGGTIAGWNPAANATNAITMVDLGGQGAVFKGLARGSNASGNFLYAADFAHGKIDAFDGGFNAATLSGNFTDPNAIAGYAPFNIQNVGGKLYVAYAQQDPLSPADEVAGAGQGYVNVFDTDGNFLKRLATGTPTGPLSAMNAPWGFAQAPGNFGSFSNALLVGQFGNGQILAFNPTTNAFLGALTGVDHLPLTVDGLWGIGFGNGGNGGPTNALYFSAGPNGERDGLFGNIRSAAPEPGTLPLAGLGILTAAAVRLRRRRSA